MPTTMSLAIRRHNISQALHFMSEAHVTLKPADDPRPALWRFAPAWAGLGLVMLAFGVDLAVRLQIPFPQCMLRKFTGIPCPTCGCTRSLLAWSHFDLPAAFRFNPLFFVVCIGLLAWFVLWCAEWLSGRVWLEGWSARIPRR